MLCSDLGVVGAIIVEKWLYKLDLKDGRKASRVRDTLWWELTPNLCPPTVGIQDLIIAVTSL